MDPRRTELGAFQRFERAGRLLVQWEGEPLDLYSMAILQLNLQEIVERVSYWLVAEAGLLYPLPGRPRNWRGLPPWQPVPRIIRAIPDTITVGSLFQEVSFFIANVLADGDFRSVLQNLAANIIWAVSVSGVRGVRGEPLAPAGTLRSHYRERPDPVEIGPNLRATIIALAESVPQGNASITLRSTGTEHDVQIRINVDNRPG